jgi:CheY-like chemotaxis protein
MEDGDHVLDIYLPMVYGLTVCRRLKTWVADRLI